MTVQFTLETSLLTQRLITVNDYGIEVVNSNVVIENCAAIRFRKAGWKFNNSKVVLSRSAFSYRNYKLTSPTAREAETGYGFHAINSEISLSSIPLDVDFTSMGDNGASGSDCKVIASRNYAGFVLDNSKLTGGIPRSDQLGASIVGSELNTGYGFVIRITPRLMSKVLLMFTEMTRVFKANNSKFVFENLCVDAHSNEAIRCRKTLSSSLIQLQAQKTQDRVIEIN